MDALVRSTRRQGLDEATETCAKCGKPIDDNEYVSNWGTCEECFDKEFEVYLHGAHLRLQLKAGTEEME